MDVFGRWKGVLRLALGVIVLLVCIKISCRVCRVGAAEEIQRCQKEEKSRGRPDLLAPNGGRNRVTGVVEQHRGKNGKVDNKGPKPRHFCSVQVG